jgi:hypothetical protein
MKTTPLNEILKQITPLPWVADSIGIWPVDTSRGWTVADCSHAALDPEYQVRPEQSANAAYLTHAANVLPGLVEALRECREMLAVAMNAEENPFGIHHNQATDAISLAEITLATATNVPTNS